VIRGAAQNRDRSKGIPGLISFKLSLEQPTDVSFDVEFRGISATPEVDFTATPLRVTIQAGDTYESESVYVFNDDIFEGPETFEIIIKNVVGARLPNGQSEWAGTYLIADTDLSPVPAFTIRSLSGERAEGTGSNGLFSFEVSRPYGGEGTAANVSWQVMGSGANPASVTDFAGGEFPAGSLSFATGEVAKTIILQVAGDATPELDEGFTVHLRDPSSGFTLAVARADGLIRNDDGIYRPGYLAPTETEAATSYFMGDGETAFILSGVSSSDVTGNGEQNQIIGNNAANRLLGKDGHDLILGEGGDDNINGGPGADTMHGGLGNDEFHVDNPEDQVTENDHEGRDRVVSSVSFNLPSSIEELWLLGTLELKGRGNALANLIEGNEGQNDLQGYDGNDTLHGGIGADTLDGGAGEDSMRGGAGDDLFFVMDTGDVVLELAHGGADTIITAINLTLPDHVEALRIAEGVSGITISGGAGNDMMIGNGLANTFNGGAGDDVILAGNVTLADIYALFAT
jgi:Ca2+-binding RTX toxin-like protein